MSLRRKWRRHRNRCEQCGYQHVSYFCPNCGRDLYHSGRQVIDPDNVGKVSATCACGNYSLWNFDAAPMPIRIHP